jgi:hypothetical protein
MKYFTGSLTWTDSLDKRPKLRKVDMSYTVYTALEASRKCCDKFLIHYVAFEVLTAVVVKGKIFWDITLCSPLSVNGRFGGTYRFYLQGRKNKFSKKPEQKHVSNFYAGFLLNLIFDPEDGGNIFL